MFIFFYKNKGILIPAYFVGCLIGCVILFGAVLKLNIMFCLGMTLLFTAGWTYLTKNDYYKDKEGNKVKVDIENEFFWISMFNWARILLVLAVLCFAKAIYDMAIHSS